MLRQDNDMPEATGKYDNLTVVQVGKLFSIQIVPYNPDWIIIYEQEKALISGVLGDAIALNIEHFGSTSVAGLLKYALAEKYQFNREDYLRKEKPTLLFQSPKKQK